MGLWGTFKIQTIAPTHHSIHPCWSTAWLLALAVKTLCSLQSSAFYPGPATTECPAQISDFLESHDCWSSRSVATDLSYPPIFLSWLLSLRSPYSFFFKEEARTIYFYIVRLKVSFFSSVLSLVYSEHFPKNILCKQ
jgi:hypothetical protein